MNYISEHISDPIRWNLNDPRYDWLTEEDKAKLSEYGFDYGDVLKAETTFTPYELIPDYLGTTEGILNDYCLILWRKPWSQVHAILRVAARGDVIENVFAHYAKQGSSTAMQIMATGVMKVNEEGERKGITIRIVNDIEGNE